MKYPGVCNQHLTNSSKGYVGVYCTISPTFLYVLNFFFQIQRKKLEKNNFTGESVGLTTNGHRRSNKLVIGAILILDCPLFSNDQGTKTT